MSQEAKSNKKRIFLTGATGSMGLPATTELVSAGHDVVGTTRSRPGAAALFEATDDGLTAINVVRNPDKLRRLAAAAMLP